MLIDGYAIFFKIFVLILEALYVFFAFVVTRQINLLNESFNTPYKGFFNLISWIHFFVSLGVFALSILFF